MPLGEVLNYITSKPNDIIFGLVVSALFLSLTKIPKKVFQYLRKRWDDCKARKRAERMVEDLEKMEDEGDSSNRHWYGETRTIL